MPCFEGTDDVDFNSGIVLDDPLPPTSEIGIMDTSVTVDENDNNPKARFVVTVSPINFNAQVTVQYATRNGTAQAGTHYTSKSGTVTFIAGDANEEILIDIRTPDIDADLRFWVDLSAPTNAILDPQAASASADVSFRAEPDEPGPGPTPNDPAKLRRFVGWKPDDAVVYEQFKNCCCKNMCTSFAAAAFMSAAWFFEHHERKRFSARTLFQNSGNSNCCSCASNCPDGFETKVLPYMRSTGVKYNAGSNDCSTDVTGSFKKIKRFWDLTDSNRADLIKKIKRSIYWHHGVYWIGSWYSNPWNNPQKSSRWNVHLLPKMTGVANVGHAFLLTGWDDDIAGGAFQFQNSSGRDYGREGRAWIRYDQIDQNKRRSSQGHPWSRFWVISLRNAPQDPD
jgi:hypothetical protein